MRRRSLGSGVLTVEDSVTVERAATSSNKLPAERPKPQIISAVEVETDAGVFRVERPDSVLDHSDLAWAMAHLEAGEPDALVPLPRRQLALLLTLLPTPEDPSHPELDSQWGWAHRLKAPWERGPLHAQGRLGRLIAVDADLSSRGMHRACFEMLGTEEVVWALGVPCYRTGSVYELTPLRRGIRGSRWLHLAAAEGPIRRWLRRAPHLGDRAGRLSRRRATLAAGGDRRAARTDGRRGLIHRVSTYRRAAGRETGGFFLRSYHLVERYLMSRHVVRLC